MAMTPEEKSLNLTAEDANNALMLNRIANEVQQSGAGILQNYSVMGLPINASNYQNYLLPPEQQNKYYQQIADYLNYKVNQYASGQKTGSFNTSFEGYGAVTITNKSAQIGTKTIPLQQQVQTSTPSSSRASQDEIDMIQSAARRISQGGSYTGFEDKSLGVVIDSSNYQAYLNWDGSTITPPTSKPTTQQETASIVTKDTTQIQQPNINPFSPTGYSDVLGQPVSVAPSNSLQEAITKGLAENAQSVQPTQQKINPIDAVIASTIGFPAMASVAIGEAITSSGIGEKFAQAEQKIAQPISDLLNPQAKETRQSYENINTLIESNNAEAEKANKMIVDFNKKIAAKAPEQITQQDVDYSQTLSTYANQINTKAQDLQAQKDALDAKVAYQKQARNAEVASNLLTGFNPVGLITTQAGREFAAGTITGFVAAPILAVEGAINLLTIPSNVAAGKGTGVKQMISSFVQEPFYSTGLLVGQAGAGVAAEAAIGKIAATKEIVSPEVSFSNSIVKQIDADTFKVASDFKAVVKNPKTNEVITQIRGNALSDVIKAPSAEAAQIAVADTISTSIKEALTKKGNANILDLSLEHGKGKFVIDSETENSFFGHAQTRISEIGNVKVDIAAIRQQTAADLLTGGTYNLNKELATFEKEKTPNVYQSMISFEGKINELPQQRISLAESKGGGMIDETGFILDETPKGTTIAAKSDIYQIAKEGKLLSEAKLTAKQTGVDFQQQAENLKKFDLTGEGVAPVSELQQLTAERASTAAKLQTADILAAKYTQEVKTPRSFGGSVATALTGAGAFGITQEIKNLPTISNLQASTKTTRVKSSTDAISNLLSSESSYAIPKTQAKSNQQAIEVNRELQNVFNDILTAPKTKTETKQAQQQKAIQIEMPQTKQVTETSAPVIPLLETGYIPRKRGYAAINEGALNRALSMKAPIKKRKFKGAYTPSVAAVELNITGKAQNLNKISGLEIRPMAKTKAPRILDNSFSAPKKRGRGRPRKVESYF